MNAAAYRWAMFAGIVVSIAFWSRLARRDGRLFWIYIAALIGAFAGAKLGYFLAEGWLDLGRTDFWIRLATGKTIGSFAAGGEADVNLAVSAARRAFNGPWRKVTPYERGRLLQKTASLIEKHAEELAQLITLENGKPLWEAKKEVGTAVSWTEY